MRSLKEKKGIRTQKTYIHIYLKEITQKNIIEKAIYNINGDKIIYNNKNNEAKLFLIISDEQNNNYWQETINNLITSSDLTIKSIEIGQRNVLISTNNYFEWIPWRINKIIQNKEEIKLENSIKYILEL